MRPCSIRLSQCHLGAAGRGPASGYPRSLCRDRSNAAKRLHQAMLRAVALRCDDFGQACEAGHIKDRRGQADGNTPSDRAGNRPRIGRAVPPAFTARLVDRPASMLAPDLGSLVPTPPIEPQWVSTPLDPDPCTLSCRLVPTQSVGRILFTGSIKIRAAHPPATGF